MGRQQKEPTHESITTPIEHELTMRLERAHLLAERAQRANGYAQEEINRAREIADALCDEFRPVGKVEPAKVIQKVGGRARDEEW